MAEYIMKELDYNILPGLSIHIYSESRHIENDLYKHFLSVNLFGFTIFHTFWRTGVDNYGTFYIKVPFKKGDCGFGEIDRVKMDY
ncbi:hypothetical protein [Flavobacterium sp.]|uniref:hypothetical protein n=1 Tax=Flavobacterium sp. TaxID=239 RepID=UPI00262DBC7A|nr:hypothetical protein [Flavobacterium sp.]